MKALLLAVLALGMNSAFAAPLIEEAICTGKIDGEEVRVISLINPMNWCEEDRAAMDMNAAILVEFLNDEDDFFVSGQVMTATLSNPTELSAVLTSTTRGVVDVRMSYDYNEDEKPSMLEMLDENDVLQKYELICHFPQYNIECDQE